LTDWLRLQIGLWSVDRSDLRSDDSVFVFPAETTEQPARAKYAELAEGTTSKMSFHIQNCQSCSGMPKNLVICLDGTNNEFGTENTNVVRLYQALVDDPVRQLSYYDPGVGTIGHPGVLTRFMDKLTKILGMAFGLGGHPEHGLMPIASLWIDIPRRIGSSSLGLAEVPWKHGLWLGSSIAAVC
jgi:hypothetical protein